MMNEQLLRQELRKVSTRYRTLLLRTGLAICWLALALMGLAVLAWARGASRAIPGIALLMLIALPVILVPILLSWLRRVQDPLWIAHRIERRFPELDTRLLAAIEQEPDKKTRRMGFLQDTVLGQAVDHAMANGWEHLVSRGQLRLAKWSQWAFLLAFCFVVGVLMFDSIKHRSPVGGWLVGGLVDRSEAYDIKVLPEDTQIERGTALLVEARFNGRLPGDVQMVFKDADGTTQQIQMSKSLNDPLFATRVPSITKDATYAIRYGENQQTRWYKVGVFDYPDLKQADAKLKFPEYTGMAEKVVEDTRSVTAVEGTNATFTFRLNKQVKQAALEPKVRPSTNPADAVAQQTEPVKLAVDPKDPTVYTATFDMKQSQRFQLDLLDDAGRKMKQPAELVLNVVPNKPPEVQVTWPGHDAEASPLEELSLKARVSDDFGVKRVGLTYSMAGKDPQDVVLAEGVKAKEKKDVTQLVSLEKMSAEPDELLTYYFWAEDNAPDGTVRRTSGDMFFTEVRPFEEIFRQGQQPAGGEEEQQRQQQQQQNQQGGQNAQDAEQLADLQKQIIAATWKVIRREVMPQLTKQFNPDVTLISESQQDARDQASGLEERLTDERSKAFLNNVYKYMEQAKAELEKAAKNNSVAPLATALSSEQAAYQELLKLRAREFEVTRQNRQQQQRGQQQQQRSSAQQRRPRQLNQLNLDQQDNRYETQRQANPQQQQQQDQDPAQRETRQVLSRLRELAQRQEDLNRQMREIQSALQQAREQQQREELERQLARLRDQQQQQLRDTDELRDRMDQPQNEDRMADSRQQLEDTREQIRQASEALNQQQVQQASAAGARAAEQLNQLRDDFRKEASGQFNDAVSQLREQARALDQKERDLQQQLANLDQTGRANPSTTQPQQARALRDGGERQQVVQDFQQQRQQLDKLLDDMRKTIDEAEVPEPLLSQQLYDTVRQTSQQQPDVALDSTRQLLDRGFTTEARQAEADAAKGISQLREGVERAARSVLGDDTDSLRRARNELDTLAQQLDRELNQNMPGRAQNGSTTRPALASRSGATTRNALARGGATTRDANGQDDQQMADGQQNGDQQANAEQQGEGQQGARAGERGQQGQQQANAAGQRGARQGARGQRGQGQQQDGQQADGQQPGEGQEGQQQANA